MFEIAQRNESPEARSLRALIGRLHTFKIKRWGATYREELADAEEPAPLSESHVVSSIRTGSGVTPRHNVVIDIDHPAWLVKSSTPGHYHLYIDVPGGIGWDTYEQLLFALAKAGVIESGYHEVSKKRMRTDVRLPWVKKQSASQGVA